MAAAVWEVLSIAFPWVSDSGRVSVVIYGPCNISVWAYICAKEHFVKAVVSALPLATLALSVQVNQGKKVS